MRHLRSTTICSRSCFAPFLPLLAHILLSLFLSFSFAFMPFRFDRNRSVRGAVRVFSARSGNLSTLLAPLGYCALFVSPFIGKNRVEMLSSHLKSAGSYLKRNTLGQNHIENIDVNAELDYAVFLVSSNQNRYESAVHIKGRTENLVSGALDQLALHLPEAKGFYSNSSSGTFKLQLRESVKGSSWFTKSTLSRFLHIVNSPEVLKSAGAMLSEWSQLEETRKFHLALYSKDLSNRFGSGLTGDFLQDIGLVQQVSVISIDSPLLVVTSRNELLRALELRVTALKEEMPVLLSEAACSDLSTKEISDLCAFAQHFGAVDLGTLNVLFKYLFLISDNQPSECSLESSPVSRNFDDKCGNASESFQSKPRVETQIPVSNSVSPAKLAQVERLSSTESEESSSESSDKDQTAVERSRPLIRSASPRRSASPMRRIQIGRSGSRRSTALTIKSLNYFPARDKNLGNRDADESKSGDEEPDNSSKKPETTVRISVKDAISLFESKQKDNKSDINIRRASGDVGVSANKSVLRRWISEKEENKSVEVRIESDPSPGNLIPPEVVKSHDDANNCDTSSELERVAFPPMSVSTGPVKSQPEQISDRATASAEWNRQKEAELNQILMKLMESKPGKYMGTDTNAVGLEASNEQTEGFNSQHKEKRDEKLRSVNVRKGALKETVEQGKTKIVSKAGGIAEKRTSQIHPQKLRRNSSPPVLPKEVSRTPASRKASPKLSPSPAKRNLGSSGPSPKANNVQITKSTLGVTPTNTPSSRRRAQPTPPATQPSPRTERPQAKNKKATLNDVKPAVKAQEEKPKAVTKTKRSVKTKSSPALGDETGSTPKPSFYSKVTKKSSVVPLEPKPLLKKSTGTSPGIGGPVLAKSKAPQPDDSFDDSGKESESLIHAEDKESAPVTPEPTAQVPEVDLAQSENNVEDELEISPGLGISSAAWVEVEHQEVPTVCENGITVNTVSPEIEPISSLSPRIRHSLSQMLQAELSEPDTLEWGNAQNPPALVYQKDSPRGFKRLLKFARKSKGSPMKVGNQAKGFGQQKTMLGLSESFDGGNSTKKAIDSRRASAQANSSGSQKLHEGHTSRTATSTKGRSFFSLSTFRSSKSNETKHR
uniref:Uncharacterized protein n=1 Tax=Ananas comosus var. bracteatus TaxID=296719 RepID=A0A6V7QRS9_ANACO